ncbi:hypothetical protein BCV72DRAFT_199259 [Rhizopus microsporus var. microsporus]|uniref:Uncharacterized protein n=2 Tax=Rhizopus microsporus TaxID=58291 RepID=A0A2G4TAG0_RHIZD|nr:uncharacterized protein RHIMIDRAFT_297323 [Rhizopus microsporus ATCC 52813]ORE10644.1 hypothetical protein BCV72DRAFT_199259 [Rhizopus microsporus var. microsporus]PHZ18001.1 hypothetical protein RHIMIDRAFT_297323 [Rhizopus microsporus ATCC 52813]
MTTYQPKYQGTLKILAHDGLELVGYSRNSPTDNSTANTTRLLQLMVDNLKERSFASRVYVSSSSWASTPFAKRDSKANDGIMSNLKSINDNTQDLLEYLNACDHDICLISIDFASLTTRSGDLLKLIEDNLAIKKIATETLTVNNGLFIIDVQDLKENQRMLNRFDNRSVFINRPK